MKRDDTPNLIVLATLVVIVALTYVTLIRVENGLKKAFDTLDLVDARTKTIQRLISNTKDTIKPNVLYEDTWGKIILVKEEDL